MTMLKWHLDIKCLVVYAYADVTFYNVSDSHERSFQCRNYTAIRGIRTMIDEQLNMPADAQFSKHYDKYDIILYLGFNIQ